MKLDEVRNGMERDGTASGLAGLAGLVYGLREGAASGIKKSMTYFEIR